MARTSKAKDEVKSFVDSGEPGMFSEFSVQSLTNAAQDLYTAKGKNCPIKVIRVDGKTLILNRGLVANGTPATA